MPWPRFDLERQLTIPTAAPRKPDGAATGSTSQPHAEMSAGTAEDAGRQLTAARNNGAATVLFCSHDTLAGDGTTAVIDLIEQGLVTHVGLDWPAILADWQRAHGGTAEQSAAAAGIWSDPVGAAHHPVVQAIGTALASDSRAATAAGEQLGEVLLHDTQVADGGSLLKEASRHGVPVTIHSATRANAWLLSEETVTATIDLRLRRDVLLLANTVENLDRGVVIQLSNNPAFGSDLACCLQLAEAAAAPYNRNVGTFACWLATGSPTPPDLSLGTSVLATVAPACRRQLTDTISPQLAVELLRGARAAAGWSD